MLHYKSYKLDTCSFYVIAYKGGGAAEAAAGYVFANEEEEKKQWGHVGGFYYRDGAWWIAEADSGNLKILSIESSLFGEGKKMDGLFLVNTEGGKIIEQKQFKESIFGQPIVNEGKVYVLVNNGNAIVVL